MPTQPSKSDLLGKRMRRYASHDVLLLMRNMGFAASATCLVILVGLAQIGAKDIALKVSVYSASIALPVWLLLGAIYESYILLGKQSYPHLRTKFYSGFVGVALIVACSGIAAATGGIIWFLAPYAAYAFVVTSIIAGMLGGVFHAHLARWWFREGGPGMGPDDNDGSISSIGFSSALPESEEG